MLICAGLMAAGGLIAAVAVPGREQPVAAASPVQVHCAIAGPPLQPQPGSAGDVTEPGRRRS